MAGLGRCEERTYTKSGVFGWTDKAAHIEATRVEAQWEVARFSSVLCNFHSLSRKKSVIDCLFGINTFVFLNIRFYSTTSEAISRKSRKYTLIAVTMLINKLSNYTVIYGLIGILINIDYHVIPSIESIPRFPSIFQRTCAEKNKSWVRRLENDSMRVRCVGQSKILDGHQGDAGVNKPQGCTN